MIQLNKISCSFLQTKSCKVNFCLSPRAQMNVKSSNKKINSDPNKAFKFSTVPADFKKLTCFENSVFQFYYLIKHLVKLE